MTLDDPISSNLSLATDFTLNPTTPDSTEVEKW
jgi:hypothetical protein